MTTLLTESFNGKSFYPGFYFNGATWFLGEMNPVNYLTDTDTFYAV